MRKKGRPKKQKSDKTVKVPGKRGRPRRKEIVEHEPPFKKPKRGRPRTIKVEQDATEITEDPLDLASSSQGDASHEGGAGTEENYSEGLHMSTMQVRALSSLVACLECGEEVVLGVRPTTKGMISEFTVSCKVCDSQKSTNTPNLIRERKRKREKKGVILQKNENINYAHVAAFLDNGLGYSGLRHYCKYFNARCLNEATFIVYAKQVISDVVAETEEFLQQNARIVRKAFESQLQSDFIIDLTVGYTTTYHQWGSDFCLVAGAVIELQTGLVLDFDVGNMYCHVCKINAKKIVSMSPAEMTEWFNKHQDTCEIREWCDEIDQDSEEGIKEIDPKYLEAFIAKKIWGRSLEKFGFRYTTLIHESDERIHAELLKAAPYGDIPVIIDNITNCFSRRKSEHARTSFQNKLKAKCPRERVQTKDRIMYVYAMSIPEYNKFAIGSNIKLRELVRRMEIEEEEYATELSIQASEVIPAIQEQEMMEEKSGGKVGDAFELEREQEVEIQGEEEEGDEDMEEEEEEEEEDEEEEVEEDSQVEEIINSQDIEVLEEEEEVEEERPVKNTRCKVNKLKQNESSARAKTDLNPKKAIKETVLKNNSLIENKQTTSKSGNKLLTEQTIKCVSELPLDKKVNVLSGNKSAPSAAGNASYSDDELEENKSSLSELNEKGSVGSTQMVSDTSKEKLVSGDQSLKGEKTVPGISLENKKCISVYEKKSVSDLKRNFPSKKISSDTQKQVGKEANLGQRSIIEEANKALSATEIRLIATEDKVKVAAQEKKAEQSEKKESSDLKKVIPRLSSEPAASEKRKVPTENGTEEVKVKQNKQSQEVIKPFRVDFDED